MFVVIYDREGKRGMDMYGGRGILFFFEYMEAQRRNPANDELFIAGEGRVLTRLLDKLVTSENLLSEYTTIVFDEDIIARIDELIEIKPYFEKLMHLGMTIFYYASVESTITRLKKSGLPMDVRRMT